MLEQVAAGKAQASWDDGGVPRVLGLDTVTPDRAPVFPDLPADFTPMPPGFLTVLDEACRTAGREPNGRFGLTRIQLRGRRGDVVATDGRQLLIQSGFRLPWDDDILIPRTSVFSCREFACHEEVLLGRTQTHVVSEMRAVDAAAADRPQQPLSRRASRHPPQRQRRRPPGAGRARRRLADFRPAEAAGRARLQRPGHARPGQGVPPYVRRAEGSEQVTEVPLVHSATTGPPMLLHIDRRLLHRAVALGFRELEAVNGGRARRFP